MQSEEDSQEYIDRLAAYDEQLRKHEEDIDGQELAPPDAQALRLLHELWRNEPTDEAAILARDSAPLPERISRFRILRLLGRGGFGTVYLADDPLLNRSVAIKVIHAHLLRDPTMRRRALREREAMARLQHPNIIPVWEAGEDHDHLYIVSEYCAGPTLAQWLDEHPDPLDNHLAARWISRLADAIAHSHQRGVIHRDLKPSNILLDSPSQNQARQTDGIEHLEPRLSDFGLAKILHPSPMVTSLPTQKGIFVGSLEYASPEQVKGHNDAIGVGCDIYGLGVLLFQLLTGSLPHSAETQYELARRICEEYPRFPKNSSHIPKDLQAIALHAMAREPGDRYPSAHALQDDLARYLRGETVIARPVSMLENFVRVLRSHPGVSVLAVAFCLLTLLFLYNLVVSNSQLAQQSRALEAALRITNDQRQDADHQRLLAIEREQTVKKLRYRESIRLAFDQWQQQNFIGLHDTLSRIEPDRSQTWEFTWLKDRLTETYFKFDLNNDPVQGLLWNPIDQRILTIGSSGKLRRWQLDNPQAVQTDQTAIGAHCLALHPDGETLAMPEGTKSKVISFWNYANSSRHQATVQYHSTTVESLEYSPNGKWLAAGPRYAPVLVTELESNDSFAVPSDRRNRQVAFSPESDRVAVYVTSGEIEIRSLRDRTPLIKIKNELAGGLASIYSLAWIPGQDAIVACARPERLNIYSTTDGRKLADAHTSLKAESIAVSPDGHRVALGDSEGVVQLFDLEAMLRGNSDDLALTPAMRVLDGKITDLTFCDTNSIVAADEEGNMIRWTMPAGPASYMLANRCQQLFWHDNEHFWVYGDLGRALHYFKVGTQSLEPLNEKPTHFEGEVARAQNSKYKAIASAKGRISILNGSTDELMASCELSPGRAIENGEPVSDILLFSHDGKTLYTTGENNMVTALSVPNAEILWTTKFTNAGFCLSENYLTGELYLGGGFEPLTILKSSSGEVLEERIAGNGTFTILAQPEQDRLITGHKDGTLRIGHLNSKTPPLIHRVSRDAISALVMTSDEKSLIIGDEEGQIRIADLEIATYCVQYKTKLTDGEVGVLKWSPDQRKLAALFFSPHEPRSEIVIFEPGSVNGPRQSSSSR